MVNVYKIFQICPQCRGRKIVDTTKTTPDPDDAEPGITTKTCPMCNGEGEVKWGRMQEDID